MTGSLLLTACNQEQGAPQPDEQSSRQMEEFVVRWHTRTEDMNAIMATHKQYKAFTAAQLDEFDRVNARYQVEQLGNDKQLWELLARANKHTNKLSVERYQKGYNQLEGRQLDNLLKEVHSLPVYGQIKSLVVLNEQQLQSPANARPTAGSCLFPEIRSTCGSPYVMTFEGQGAVPANYLSTTNNRCANWAGAVRVTGQSDCDYFLDFRSLDIPYGGNPENYWLRFYCFTADAYDIVSGGIGKDDSLEPPDKVSRRFCFPGYRTDQKGGIQVIGSNVRLNRGIFN
ncbi:MAG: hypothetical protein AVDCRST_MAG56-4316 [uncultured Cytophagales bacterium]|uniref:Uncharacterized protein n=1 Tax=uncultured Cytophagales bacterium TaxID=158755 RepID=A0A6J4JUN8_9SPHI|nr:MAG: hypothetical protein AVDCRST_MAG56-4316 [uncultured Cytophagales bacterium]